jgi:phosphatidylserine decarboxylase
MASTAVRHRDAARPLARFFLQEDLNFLVTNRIPRRLATRAMASFSRIRSRRLTRVSLRVWQLFADDLRLDEAEQAEFDSLHECFTRRLKAGARPIDADRDVVVSPCDAIVGAHGPVIGTRLIQAKGLGYTLRDLLGDAGAATTFEQGTFITLRLQANMYHRFHAPCDGRVRKVTYIAGDTWNVNPIALERVERLFCRNERAVVTFEPDWPSTALAMVPIAAILVGGIRFSFLPTPLTLRHRGQTSFDSDVALPKGKEMGRFEAGSTIVLLVSGPFRLVPGLACGQRVSMGRALLRYAAHSPDHGGCPS